MGRQRGRRLTAIDAATNTVATTVRGIEGPHNVQAAPDGRTVWAVSGHESLAAMLDASTLALHGAASTGGAPAHIVVPPTATGRTTPMARTTR